MLLASGQVTTSATATALSSVPIGAKKWVFKALSSNTSQIGVGPLTQISGAGLTMGNAHLMDPGDDFEIDCTIQQGAVFGDTTPDKVYVVGAGGVVSWLAFG